MAEALYKATSQRPAQPQRQQPGVKEGEVVEGEFAETR